MLSAICDVLHYLAVAKPKFEDEIEEWGAKRFTHGVILGLMAGVAAGVSGTLYFLN